MTYSSDIINLCFSYLHGKEFTKQEISQILKISVYTINSWIKKYNKNYINLEPITEKTIDDYKHQNIHKSSKKHLYYEIIKEYVNNHEGCNLKDIRNYGTNNSISLSSVCRSLKNLNITTKKINTTVVCKDIHKIEEDRKIFAQSIENTNENFYNYISIDESSFCVNDYLKKGYSMKGKSIHRLIKHRRNKERYSLLMAISNKKIVAYEIYDKSVNSVEYLKFIEKNKNKFVNNTLLQDNVRFHHAKIVKKFTKDNNINMKYIPPYTPIFNPIEMCFSKIKKEFRNLDHANVRDDIVLSIDKLKNDNLNNYYSHVIKDIKKYV